MNKDILETLIYTMLTIYDMDIETVKGAYGVDDVYINKVLNKYSNSNCSNENYKNNVILY